MKKAASVRLVTFLCLLGVIGSSASVLAAGTGERVAEPRWTGSIRSARSERALLTDTARPRSSGSVKWTAGRGPGQSVVELSFSYGGEEQVLSWAILFGSCNSESMTLLPVSAFPELELNTVGTGKVTANLALDFPTSGNYRVEVYRDRMGSYDSIVACGNLRYSK